jgi:uncharacterized membrane protein HdeD (DUF308 family)
MGLAERSVGPEPVEDVSDTAIRQLAGVGVLLGFLAALFGLVLLSEPAPSLVLFTVTLGVILLILGIIEIFASVKVPSFAAKAV